MKKEHAAQCPNCKTGADTLKLDKREPMCPYLYAYTENGCKKYVPISGGGKA